MNSGPIEIEEKHALIDCEYFAECYNHNSYPASYLCPHRKEECGRFYWELLLEERETEEALKK